MVIPNGKIWNGCSRGGFSRPVQGLQVESLMNENLDISWRASVRAHEFSP